MPPASTELTFTEAKLLVLLLEGHTPLEAAARLGVRISTVRSHLKRAHVKAGTHSIAALLLWARERIEEQLTPALAADPRWSGRARNLLTKG